MLSSGFPVTHREAIKNPFERGPRVFDREERSNARSKTRTMSPPRAVSAPSGDLCGCRALRAPQEQGENVAAQRRGFSAG